jgi:biotin operon repressor
MTKVPKRSQRVVVPKPERIRALGCAAGFGWLDARLVHDGWLSLLTPEDLAVYVFLCLVANRQGVSWYRRDRIRHALDIDEQAVWQALKRLEQLGLVAYRPFHRNASEGFRQVLPVPVQGPADHLDWQGGER